MKIEYIPVEFPAADNEGKPEDVTERVDVNDAEDSRLGDNDCDIDVDEYEETKDGSAVLVGVAALGGEVEEAGKKLVNDTGVGGGREALGGIEAIERDEDSGLGVGVGSGGNVLPCRTVWTPMVLPRESTSTSCIMEMVEVTSVTAEVTWVVTSEDCRRWR